MKNLLTFLFALKDPRTPWYAKFTALLSALYLLSPVDIVPDLIPFAGYIDDIVIVPLLMSLSTGLLPSDVRIRAMEKAKRNRKKWRWIIVAAIVLLIGLMVLIYYWLRSRA